MIGNREVDFVGKVKGTWGRGWTEGRGREKAVERMEHDMCIYQLPGVNASIMHYKYMLVKILKLLLCFVTGMISYDVTNNTEQEIRKYFIIIPHNYSIVTIARDLSFLTHTLVG